MLIFNGLAYGRTNKEVTETLFSPINGRTANGYYKRIKHGIQLFNLKRELIAFIVARRHDTDTFIVSASKRSDGKTWYMHSTCDNDEKYLGLDKLSYSEKIEECEKVFKQAEAAF